MSEFGFFGLLAQDANTIHVQIPYHPTMVGLDNAGLSNYSDSAHALVLSFPLGWDVTATGVVEDGPAGKGRFESLPVVIALGDFPPAPPIPALGPLGLIVLVMTLAGGAWFGFRRR